MPEDSIQTAPTSPTPANPWVKPAMWIVVLVLLLASAIYVFKSVRDLPVDTLGEAGEVLEKTSVVIDKTSQALKEIAAAFNQGTITTSFISYATSINANHYLQFATLRQHEVFTRKDEASTGFGYIPLPDVVVEASAPVHYTFYVDFGAKWEFVLKDNVIYVLAPPIHANEPSVDVSKITYEVKKDSVFRKTGRPMDELKKSIMSMVQQRAKDNVGLVRDTGRREIAGFVEKWLAHSFVDASKYPLKIYFEDETLPEVFSVVVKRVD